jgi:hypothetical protein
VAREINALPHFRNVVLNWWNVGYFPEGHPQDNRSAGDAGIDVYPFGQRMYALRDQRSTRGTEIAAGGPE